MLGRREFARRLGTLASLPLLPACAGSLGGGAEAGQRFDELHFAFDLWRASELAGNAAIAPASVATVLAMLEVGAGGQTRRELDRALHARDREALVSSISARAQAWAGTSEPRLRSAQALWVRSGVALEPDYVRTLTSDLRASAAELPDEPFAAREAINAWVAEQTEQRIPALLDEPPRASSIAVVVSALHFAGSWAIPFDLDATSSSTFTREDGVAVEVPMMWRKQAFRLAFDGGEDEQGEFIPGYLIAELPYLGELGLDMLVLLPPRGSTLAAGLAGLDFARMSALLAQFDASELPFGPVLLGMPRFRVDSHISLIEPLRRLGVVDGFDERANFRAMTRAPVSITAFEHAVALEVDEVGTVASAATMAESGLRSGPSEVILDRPFWYVIRQRGGPWLFVGQITDPLAA